jgi:choloylglycine hydrolase
MAGGIKDPGRCARWTSKYGSVTFNQYGRETPMGGMNEAGLVIEVMMLMDTVYPEPDSRPTIKSLQWIQYQLDNFSKVEEVLASNSQLRILYEGAGVHYLVMDKTGNCASIEFLNGRFVCHTQETMPVKALTNSTYAESVAFLKRHRGFGGNLPIPSSEASLDRFVRASKMLKRYEPKVQPSMVDYAFDILANVAQTSTMWRIVYDVQKLRVHFITLSNQKRRTIDLKALDFSCLRPVKVLDINADLSGKVTNSFCDYTQKINYNLIRDAFKGTYFLMDVPNHILEERSRYPESTLCME